MIHPEPVPATMQAVLLKGHGGLEQLEVREDVTVPAPGAGEVLILVGAAAINNTDINTRLGWYSKQMSRGTGEADAGRPAETGSGDASWAGAALHFPRIQGIDVCGRIAAVGPGVDPMRLGERILVEPCLREPVGWAPYRCWFLGSECDGGFAQFVAVPSVHAYRIESPLSDIELASFPCAYSTAENLLTRAGLQAGETLLVTGASGGVGSAVVQLAKRRGATVIAVAAAEKQAEVVALGSDRVFPRDADLVEALGEESLEVVVDLVGGEAWPQLPRLLRRGGRYAVAGAIAGPLVELDLRTLYLKDLSFFGCAVLEPEVFGNLVGYIERGEVRPLVARSYPLAEIVEAQRDFLAKRFTGKLVLVPGGMEDGAG